MQMSNPNLFSLIGPISIALIGQKHLFWLVIVELFWLASEDANEVKAV